MNKILRFYKRTKNKWFLPTISIAIIIGGVAGFYAPELSSRYRIEVSMSNNDRVKGDVRGSAIITDGDTIKINGTRIRFHGIDAPEIDQQCWIEGRSYMCGVEAKAYLNTIINNQTVNCVTESTDQYGRKVAQCYNYKNEDIEALMVSAGMAVAYTYYSYDYIIEEVQARLNDTGIWVGEFENPYDFRRK